MYYGFGPRNVQLVEKNIFTGFHPHRIFARKTGGYPALRLRWPEQQYHRSQIISHLIHSKISILVKYYWNVTLYNSLPSSELNT